MAVVEPPIRIPADGLTPPPPPPARPPARRPRHWAFYLFLVLLIPAIFYPLPFFLVLLPSYEHWTTSQFGPVLEYAFDPQPKHADVVIFGDSSAFLGIDPRILNRELGIRSVLLPDTVSGLPVTGEAPIQSYLAHNPAPRLLVLYFAPWNLEFTHGAQGRLFEGEEMLLRHMSRREILHFTLAHPADMLKFPFRLYATFGPKIVRAALHHVDRERPIAEALGHADYSEPFVPLPPSCTLPPAYLANTATTSVEQLVHRYSTPQTEVMVYLAPIPACPNSREVLARSFAAVGAAPPQVLPPELFASDGYFVHLKPGAVRTASLLLAHQLAHHLSPAPTP